MLDFTLSSVQVLLKCSSHVEIVKYGGLRILSLLLADDVVLLVYQAITYGLHWSGWQQNNKQLWWKIFKFETQFKTKVEAVQASDDDASWAPHRWGVSNSLSPWDQSRPRTCWRDVREVAQECLSVHREEVEITAEREVWASLVRLLPLWPGPR